MFGLSHFQAPQKSVSPSLVRPLFLSVLQHVCFCVLDTLHVQKYVDTNLKGQPHTFVYVVYVTVVGQRQPATVLQW